MIDEERLRQVLDEKVARYRQACEERQRLAALATSPTEKRKLEDSARYFQGAVAACVTMRYLELVRGGSHGNSHLP